MIAVLERDGDKGRPVRAPRSHDEVAAAEHRRFRCAACRTEISSPEHVFAPGDDGVQVYLNPGGYLHEVVTVTRTWNVVSDGEYTEEFTWFPGYAWCYLHCAACGAHVGWRYLGNGPPSTFDGLRRVAILFDQPGES